jgi:hypothetical protein
MTGDTDFDRGNISRSKTFFWFFTATYTNIIHIITWPPTYPIVLLRVIAVSHKNAYEDGCLVECDIVCPGE